MTETRNQFFTGGKGIVHCFELSGILILVLDREGEVRYINRKGCEVLGCEREETEGLDWIEKFIHPDDREIFKSAFSDILDGRTDEYETIEGRILLKDGGYRTILWHNLAITDDNNEVFEIISIGEDTEERRNLELTFSLKNKAVETSINGIIIADMNANIVYANPSFALMHGYDSPEEVVGLHITEFFIDPAEMKNMYSEFMEKGRYQGNSNIRKKNGEIIIDQSSVFKISLDDSDNFFTVVSMVDVTENEKTRVALANANKKLNILSGVTRHDILNEVMVASGYLELFADASPEEKIEYVKMALTAVDRIKRDAVFSRDYQDLGGASPEWQNARKIVENYIVHGDQYKNIEVILDIGNIEIYADPMLPKVFANIMSNSVIHGEHVSKITLSSSEGDSGAFIISIEDDGVGIPDKIRSSLFKPALGRHHGFGLYLVKEILSITDIDIIENGTPGKGARFEIIVSPENWKKV